MCPHWQDFTHFHHIQILSPDWLAEVGQPSAVPLERSHSWLRLNLVRGLLRKQHGHNPLASQRERFFELLSLRTQGL
jgi:hypothetical protein